MLTLKTLFLLLMKLMKINFNNSMSNINDNSIKVSLPKQIKIIP